MRRALLALAAVAMAVPLAAGDPPELLRLRAFAVNTNSSLRTRTIHIVIERWRPARADSRA